MKTSIQFPFALRGAMVVAQAILRELYPEGSALLPLLSIRGETGEPLFHFEGGTTVKVVLNPHPLPAPFSEKWEVERVIIRYYPDLNDPSIWPPQKKEEIWKAEKLFQIRKKYPWGYNPVIRRER